MFEQTKLRLQAQGESPDCVGKVLIEALEDNPKAGYDEDAVKDTLAMMYLGTSPGHYYHRAT